MIEYEHMIEYEQIETDVFGHKKQNRADLNKKGYLNYGEWWRNLPYSQEEKEKNESLKRTG